LKLGATLSQGLGGRTAADGDASGIPLSRLGAGPGFTKITGDMRVSQPLPAGTWFDVIGSGQLSMGRPMLLSEQFALDGSEAISAFAAGTFNADQGATLRAEFLRPYDMRWDVMDATISPYVFGAIGHGRLFDATDVEQSTLNAATFGLGTRSKVRTSTGFSSLNLSLEIARQLTNVPGAGQGWRGNANATVAF
jgi:hemolysin activation/secretion protein